MVVPSTAGADAGGDPQRPSLFDPLRIRHRELKNRIAYPATITLLGNDGCLTEKQIAYYERRARGGVGLIITEGMGVHPTSRPHPSILLANKPEGFAGLQQLATRVRAHGTALLMQVWHVGRQLLWGPSVSPWGMSALPDQLNRIVPHPMTIDEIEEIIQAYISAARVARDAGFDGVEVHGAHGYLITQSLSSGSNQRTDAYGGDRTNRMRLLLRVLTGIRTECGDDFIIALKLTGDELAAGGLTVPESSEIARLLAESGLVDLLTVAQGNFSRSLPSHVPDMTFEPSPYRHILAAMRQAAAPIPFMAVGRIPDRTLAQELLATGEADLIGLGRPLISDPDLPNKWSGTIAGPVRPCIFCNYCWDMTRGNQPITCIHNGDVIAGSPAATGPRAGTPRKVHVIGAGPAGLETAWVAAARGHDVTIWEKGKRLGGQVAHLSAAQRFDDFATLIDFQCRQLADHGVEVRLESAVDAQSIAALDADVVVVATGSVPNLAGATAVGASGVASPFDVEEIIGQGPAGHALVHDQEGGLYAYAGVFALLEAGWRVTVSSPDLDFGLRLGLLQRFRIQELISTSDVTMMLGREIAGVHGNVVTLRHIYTGSDIEVPGVDRVVWAGPRTPSDDLVGAARALFETVVIGDARSPRDIASAIKEGSDIANAL